MGLNMNAPPVMNPTVSSNMKRGSGLLPNPAAAWGGWAMAPDGQMVRQPIVYSKCVLFPPNPNAPTPTLREKPVGCRTIFIGGIPEKTTEEVVRDIFEKCGPIQT